MLKKLCLVALSSLIVLSCVSCGSESSPATIPVIGGEESSQPLVVDESDIEAYEQAQEEEREALAHKFYDDEREDAVIGDIDIDLSVLSTTMVYSQVFDIMSYPSEYVGQTIKAVGTFYADYYEPIDEGFTYVVINDATGCCPQGLEFLSTQEMEIPKDGSTVEIVGVFEEYMSGDFKYYRIVTNGVTVIE